MIDRGDEELFPWECVYNYDCATQRACLRLDDIAKSEIVLGYEDSARMYKETAIEIKQSRTWYHQEYMEAIEAASAPPEVKKAVVVPWHA